MFKVLWPPFDFAFNVITPRLKIEEISPITSLYPQPCSRHHWCIRLELVHRDSFEFRWLYQTCHDTDITSKTGDGTTRGFLLQNSIDEIFICELTKLIDFTLRIYIWFNVSSPEVKVEPAGLLQ